MILKKKAYHLSTVTSDSEQALRPRSEQKRNRTITQGSAKRSKGEPFLEMNRKNRPKESTGNMGNEGNVSRHPEERTNPRSPLPIKRTVSMKRKVKESIREKLLSLYSRAMGSPVAHKHSNKHSGINNEQDNHAENTAVTTAHDINKNDKQTNSNNDGSMSARANVYVHMHSRNGKEHDNQSRATTAKESSLAKRSEYMNFLPFGGVEDSLSSTAAPAPKCVKRVRKKRKHRPRLPEYVMDRLNGHFKKLVQAELYGGNDSVCKLGDGEIRSEDIRRLRASPDQAGTDAWLNDEVINSATSLGKDLKWGKDVYILNTQTVGLLYRGELQLNNTQGKEKYEERLTRIAKRLIKSNRKGQLGTIVDSSIVIAPSLVGGFHWVSFVADKKKRQITLLDSLHSATATDSDKIARALSNLLCAVEKQSIPPQGQTKREFTFQGHFADYPTQPNGSDCGIFAFLGVHAVCSGAQPAVDEKALQSWRDFLAFAILQCGTLSQN